MNPLSGSQQVRLWRIQRLQRKQIGLWACQRRIAQAVADVRRELADYDHAYAVAAWPEKEYWHGLRAKCFEQLTGLYAQDARVSAQLVELSTALGRLLSASPVFGKGGALSLCGGLGGR